MWDVWHTHASGGERSARMKSLDEEINEKGSSMQEEGSVPFA